MSRAAISCGSLTEELRTGYHVPAKAMRPVTPSQARAQPLTRGLERRSEVGAGDCDVLGDESALEEPRQLVQLVPLGVRQLAPLALVTVQTRSARQARTE